MDIKPPDPTAPATDNPDVRPPAPGFPRLTLPYRAFNDNPQLHLEGLIPRMLTALNSMHHDMSRHHRVEFDQAVIVQCLLQVLLAKGVVTKEELDVNYPQMAAGLEVVRAKQITGPHQATPPPDAVDPVDLDCSAHHATCNAACCTSFNVFLTAEEAASNKYLWDIAMPYRLLVDDDGTCVYFDRDNFKCSIWKDRPASCRHFDCRSDGRIWEDYPQRTLSAMMMDSKARQAAARQRERAAAARAATEAER